jgi:hypothetical protein
MLLGAKIRHVILGVLVIFATTSCSTFGPTSAVPCTPHFPYAEGWLGADGGYSIPLADGRSVWLFSDTFVGVPGQPSRENSEMIHNSIGLSRCADNGRWNIDYAWGQSDRGEPAAFFHQNDATGYWWLFDGFEHRGALYVGLLRIEPSEPRGPLALPFRNTGLDLARIANYDENPEQWQYEVLPLTDREIALPGSALVVDDGFLYLFSFFGRDDANRNRILARLPLSALAENNPGASLETWAVDRRWIAGFKPKEARVIMDDNATEMSVRYFDAINAWVAVYSDLDAAMPKSGAATMSQIRLRTAPRLEGPWSKSRSIYRIPELEGNYAERIDPNVFCYAAKEHPQYATEDRLILTYVCNLMTRSSDDPWDILKRLATQMDLYRPQVVAVPVSEFGFDEIGPR